MTEIENRFGHWVLKYRWWIILLTLIGVGLAASGGRHLGFTTNYRVFFSSDNPQLLAFEAMENTYTKNDNVLFVLAPRDGDVFSADSLTAIRWLTEQAWQTPFSIRVDSISNFQHTRAEDDDLIVEDLVGEGADLGTPGLQRVRQVALEEPLLVGRLVAASGAVAGVNVTVQLPGRNELLETPEVVRFARELADRLRAEHPGIDVYLTGMVLLNNAFSESSKNDMQTLIPISFGLMLLVLGLLLRSFAATLGTLLVIAFSIVSAMGIGGWLGFPISPPSASSPTIILTVAIANSVHVLVSMLHDMRAGHGRDAAIVESLRINLAPVALASVTTAIGFLSMNFSDVPPFNHLGNIVAAGVVVSFFLAVGFLPAVMSLLPLRVRVRNTESNGAMEHFGDFVVARRTPLLWGSLVVILSLIALVPRNELNDVFVNYFDTSIQFRTDSDFTTANLTGLYQIQYSLESGQPGGISDAGFLAEVGAFAQWYRAQPETLHVDSLTDILSRLNRNLHADDPQWHRLPRERELAAQYLLLYEMSLPYGLDLNNQINVDKSATRLTATLRTLSTNEVLALEQRAQAWLQANATHIKVHDGSGTTLMFAHIGKRNILSMLVGTTLALIAISLLLVLALRSLKIGLISMVPNLVPAAMAFGIWGLFVGEVGLALSVVTGMTLGIVVDDTVHFLSKYLRARREKNHSPADAVRYAFHTVGRALVVTSIVLVAGFLVLSGSSFELNAGMGLLTAVVISLALAADFLFLPPLLMKIEELKNETSVADSAAAVADSSAA